MTPPLPTGTRVQISTSLGWTETGRVLRWTKRQGRREEMPDWHHVRFDSDGAQLLVHRDGLRVA